MRLEIESRVDLQQAKLLKMLINAPFVRLLKDRESLIDAVEKIIIEHLEQEKALDIKVKEIIEEHYEDY